MFRNLYGNMWELHGIDKPDVKINDINEEYNVTTGARKAIKQEDRNMVVEQGRTEIENAIPELGILDEARACAVRRFTSMVEHLGFSQVNITFADEIEK